jgi:phosphoserine phosphatase
MNKHYTGTGMKYTFDYVYKNGLPENIYKNLTETKIRTYINLNDISFNVLRTIEYLKGRKIKTAIVSAGSHVFAQYLSELMGIDYYIGNEVDVENRNFIKNVDPVKKDTNVKDIQAKYGISPGETISVGDSYTDLSMKRKSRYFVAFNSATSRLMSTSDFIINSINLYDIIDQMAGR